MKIQEICTKIGTRIFEIDPEMTEKIELKVGNPQKMKLNTIVFSCQIQYLLEFFHLHQKMIS